MSSSEEDVNDILGFSFVLLATQMKTRKQGRKFSSMPNSSSTAFEAFTFRSFSLSPLSYLLYRQGYCCTYSANILTS